MKASSRADFFLELEKEMVQQDVDWAHKYKLLKVMKRKRSDDDENNGNNSEIRYFAIISFLFFG
jgi:hypothetical protein